MTCDGKTNLNETLNKVRMHNDQWEKIEEDETLKTVRMYDGQNGNSAQQRLNLVRMPDVQNDGAGESGSYETLNEVNMVRMNMGEYSEGSGMNLVNIKDDKHSKNMERKLVTPGRKCEENQVTKSDEVRKYPRVAQSSKAKELQVQDGRH